jgi:signal transduction histidine kinase
VSGAQTAIGRVRAFVGRYPTAADTVAALALFMVLGVRGVAHDSNDVFAAAVLFHAGLTLPLAFRRRAPFAVFAFMALTAFGQWWWGTVLPSDFALLIALYTVAAHASLRKLFGAVMVMELGVVLSIDRWSVARADLRLFIFLSGMTTAAAVVGLNLRTRRAYLAALEDRAARLELERDQQAQIAAADERARIAREIHDIVSHSLSVMVALTDGASFALPTAPDRAADAIGKASDVGRQAMTEMQRILGVLRDGGLMPGSGPEFHPQPGLGQIDELLTDVRVAGLPVELIVDGRPPALPPGFQLAVYRVVQEALTNTRKYAGLGASARVVLRYREELIEVEVTDNGLPPTGPAGVQVGGHGIVGMRERVAPYGGSLEAGPMPNGGWRVSVSLPSSGLEGSSEPSEAASVKASSGDAAAVSATATAVPMAVPTETPARTRPLAPRLPSPHDRKPETVETTS